MNGIKAPDDINAVDVPSELSRHVALWVLLTLVANTMAQAATFQNDGSIYFHSSPLYSIVNACWRLISTFVLSRTLKDENLYFSTVMKIATRLQIDGWKMPSVEPLSGTDNEVPPVGKISTWPRWLFFVMGPLPAAIKLCSFRGAPGTQALGLMSLLSFFLNEVMHVLTGPPRAIPQVAALLNMPADVEEEVEGRKQLKDSIKTASDLSSLLETLLWLLFGGLHLFLLIWAEIKVWNVLCDFLAVKENNTAKSWRNAFIWMEMGITLFYCLGYITILATWVFQMCIGSETLRKWMSQADIMRKSTFLFFSTILLPHKNERVSRSRIYKLAFDLDAVVFYPYLAFWFGFKMMRVIVRRWPRIGKALFLDKRPVEIKTEAKDLEDTTEDIENTDGHQEIDETLWASWCLFLMNVGTTCLYYIYIFDETGTVNPEWTEVFGR